MSDDEALIREQREQIAETREDLAEKVEALREKVDVKHRGEQKLLGWQTTLASSAKEFRQGFAADTTAAGESGRAEPVAPDGPGEHRGAARRGTRVRELGEAAVAAGWRRKAAEGLAPRVAGSAAPVSGVEVRAALGLLFLAMSGSYVLKTVLTAMRHGDDPQLQPSTYRTPGSQRPAAYVVAATTDHSRVRTRRTRPRRGGQL